MTIMTRAAGPHRMGRLMAILGIPMLLGPILGPILGGWLIDQASWHWIFLINVPLGIGALVYAWLVLPKDDADAVESFDFFGMLLLSPGLALFLFGVSSLPGEGGDYTRTRVLGLGAHRCPADRGVRVPCVPPEHPLLDLRLFKNRNLTVSIITMFMFGAAFFGGLLLVPTYFQQIAASRPRWLGPDDRAAGCRRDADDADRRHARRPDAGRSHRPVRSRC